MSPTPQEHVQQQDGLPSEINLDRVVVSGMAGLYPKSRNIKEFSEILYNKVNPVTPVEDRWKFTHPEVANYSGKVAGLERFDAQFFMVHYHLANSMDPMSRKLLELAYEAIYDSGFSPSDFHGKKIGVFIATGLSESEAVNFYDYKGRYGFGITGASKTMYANRISYWLNAKGPSVAIDDACCSSSVALEQALEAINRGDCEAALVGGANLSLLPQTMVNYNRCIEISSDGKTRSFAEDADGCVKSDVINILLLQKTRDARRVYGEVIKAQNEFVSRISGETGQVFGFNRNLSSSTSFLKQFYDKVNIAPQVVEYVEAFGSASLEADKTELQAIEKIFCENRIKPLLVGSVTSNVGFTDAASGLTAMTKVLLAYHKGLVASNLHCESPRKDVAALRDGRMQLVTNHQAIGSSYVAINGLSVTGVNSHILLHGYFKPKDYSRYKSAIPRLVTISTRQEQTLSNIFEDLKSRTVDPEEIALLHNIHANNISGHLGRGYIILDTDDKQKTQCLGEKTQYSNDAQRPLWFVYSGMGSQWTEMGLQLMRIPIFSAAIEKCDKVLRPQGLDIVHIITSPDKTVFDNILHSFVGIAAIQIGLTDILKELGLKPDKIIGHSVGELACAYADGCLTAEEMILSAASRGRVSLDTKFIRGSMAAVGMGYQQVCKICPPNIEVACHNGPDSCTISGPVESISQFVAMLTANGVFAKEVPCSNIAYHSRYIAAAGPQLLQYLEEIIKDPKPRSSRWLSTSVPLEKWHEPHAKYCSAEYLTNNLLNPVLFEETCKLVPNNALLVEIAPHGLLQAILKRSLSAECKNIALTKRGHSDNAVFLLNAIGQLYIEGFTPNVQALYPKVEFPVSTGTPHLSHHVEWMHSELWNITAFTNKDIKKAAHCDFYINGHDTEHIFLEGNTVRGRVLYPFAAALVAVWDTLAMILGKKKKEVSVQFREVHLYSQPILHDQRQLKLSVSLFRGNGQFHVVEGSCKVASGFIAVVDETRSNDDSKFYNQPLTISSDEVYSNLCTRGFDYSNEFRTIHKVNEDITDAELLWNDNWVTLIDGMIQLNALKHSFSGVVQPNQIRDLSIDVEQHNKCILNVPDRKIALRAKIDPITDYTSCGGVTLRNLKFRNIAIEIPHNIQLTLAPTRLNTSTENIMHMKKSSDEERLILQIESVGDVDTLRWEKAGISTAGIEVKVHYAGINIADIKRAAGVIPFEDNVTGFGMDFSGCTKSGDRVMGLVKNGAISSVVTSQANMMWPVPSHWSLEDAATVPLAYAQAFYCLYIKNKLERNSIVLIHGGTGALGQAAISIALANGCQVFTTVADQAKKRFLRNLFPQLRDENIGNSRDSSFGEIVLNATNGEGCDIVLSCVKGELRNVCLKCTAYLGTTVDTSLLQNHEDYEYGMHFMTKCRSFMAVDFKSLFETHNFQIMNYIQVLVSEGISRGFVRPLSRVTYAPHEASRAFRLLASSRHRGRVLLRLQYSHSPPQLRISCSPEKCHVIFCDNSSAGLQLADRLVVRGAKNLHIHFTDPFSHHSLKVRFWKKLGVRVETSFGISTFDDILELLKKANESGRVEGIYVMVTDKTSNLGEMETIVNQIEGASRLACPLSKYFAVVSINSNVGEEACLTRSIDDLPSTALNIPDLEEINKEHNIAIDNSTWMRIVVDGIECALNSTHPVLNAKVKLIQPPSLIEQLAKVTGCKNLLICGDDITLKNLRIENEQLNILKSYINDSLHVTLEVNDILELTKNKLSQLAANALGESAKDVKGLSTFFSYVDLDELRGTTDLVVMNTLVTTIVGDELDMKSSFLSIVPGMEGHHERFHTMCDSFKLPALVLQPGLDFRNETPKDLARRYSKILLNKLKLKDSFYLLGYEFGVVPALELAAILESHGMTGTLFCIGDGPNGIQEQIKEQLAGFTSEEELQNAIVAHMFRLISAEDSSIIENAVQGCSSWQERVEICVSSLLGHVSHSAQYVRAVIDAAYARISTARNYISVPHKLRSKIVLLRSKASKTSSVESLQQYSLQPVSVHELAAPLAQSAKDLRCSGIINRYLSEDVLEVYNNMNLCESYAS